nr:MAG TPA: hypothetical protein [Caudoviricetes sp.]
MLIASVNFVTSGYSKGLYASLLSKIPILFVFKKLIYINKKMLC